MANPGLVGRGHIQLDPGDIVFPEPLDGAFVQLAADARPPEFLGHRHVLNTPASRIAKYGRVFLEPRHAITDHLVVLDRGQNQPTLVIDLCEKVLAESLVAFVRPGKEGIASLVKVHELHPELRDRFYVVVSRFADHWITLYPSTPLPLYPHRKSLQLGSVTRPRNSTVSVSMSRIR
jgi:hypothetical protein